MNVPAYIPPPAQLTEHQTLCHWPRNVQGYQKTPYVPFKQFLGSEVLKMASLLSKSLQGWCTDHHHAKSPSLAPRLQLHYHHLHDHTLKASNTSSSRGSSSPGPPRPQPSSAGNASISPARFLHTLEFTAIAIAAVGQAAILVSTAVCQWRQTQQLAELQDQLTAVEGSLVEAGAVAQGGMQLQRQQQLPVMQMQVPAMPMVPAHTSLHLITGSALVVGLLCGAGLRQLQMRCAAGHLNCLCAASPCAYHHGMLCLSYACVYARRLQDSVYMYAQNTT